MRIFSEDTVMLDLDVQDKDDVLRQMGKKIEATGCLKPGGFDHFMAAIRKREVEFSTAVGHDFAIPHGKSDAVTLPVIAFARLVKPVLWDAEENDRAQYVFMIAVPEESAGDEHIWILMKLAGAIMEDDFRDPIAAAKDVAQVIEIMTRYVD
ncbi:PTS sugar transporter subunit IIA [Rouxiella chamberiensis]|nr:PTS sugar transporter subunit IIA [Rouxiella chamberiensis]